MLFPRGLTAKYVKTVAIEPSTRRRLTYWPSHDGLYWALPQIESIIAREGLHVPQGLIPPVLWRLGPKLCIPLAGSQYEGAEQHGLLFKLGIRQMRALRECLGGRVHWLTVYKGQGADGSTSHQREVRESQLG